MLFYILAPHDGSISLFGPADVTEPLILCSVLHIVHVHSKCCPYVVVESSRVGNNKYVKINESEKRKGPFRVRPAPSNMHDVDGVVCQLVCKSIRDDDSAAAGMLIKHESMWGERELLNGSVG